MNACDYNPYELPTITFVGGETRDLAFHIYHYIGSGHTVYLSVNALFPGELYHQGQASHPVQGDDSDL